MNSKFQGDLDLQIADWSGSGYGRIDGDGFYEGDDSGNGDTNSSVDDGDGWGDTLHGLGTGDGYGG